MEHKYQRILAILWHWDPLREKKRPFDTVGVQEDGDSLVCRLQHGRPIQSIGKDMARCAQLAGPGGKLLMMIHRDSLHAGAHQELKSIIEKTLPEGATFDWKVFGGGDDYIYYDSERDTGLLNQEGDFAIGDSYEYLTDDRVLRERLADVAMTSSSGSPVLKKNFFEQVWLYYTLECKQMIIYGRQEYLRFITRYKPQILNLNGNPLEKLLEEKRPLLARRLKDICGNLINEGGLEIIYNKNEEILKNYLELKAFLEEAQPNQTFESVAREKFDNLIKAMPETI